MTFVYEQITGDDRQIDFTRVNSGFGRVLTVPSQWVIDRDQEAFMVCLEQEREPPYDRFYALSWRGRVFNVVVAEVEMERSDGTLTMIRKIVRVYVPDDKSTGRSELGQAAALAQDALVVWARLLESIYGRRLDEIHIESAI